MTDEYLLTNLNAIIQTFHSMIYFKLQLESDITLLMDWKNQFNGRVKMYLTDSIHNETFIHLWF